MNKYSLRIFYRRWGETSSKFKRNGKKTGKKGQSPEEGWRPLLHWKRNRRCFYFESVLQCSLLVLFEVRVTKCQTSGIVCLLPLCSPSPNSSFFNFIFINQNDLKFHRNIFDRKSFKETFHYQSFFSSLIILSTKTGKKSVSHFLQAVLGQQTYHQNIDCV